ncbi:MAG: penicillin-binding protein 2, partial [Bryobacteraceae bacterium]
VGFAPCKAPEIVVATLFENGEHGQLAAPIVRDVLKAYFDKKARLAEPVPQLASLPPLLKPPAPLPSAPQRENP